MTSHSSIGTVVSDQDTPTFETVRIKLKAGFEVKPGTLIRVPLTRREQSVLIGRVRSAYERNPNESPEDINVRETLGLAPNYPGEKDSTTIYRLIEAELIEEIIGSDIRSPQTLPNSGAEVFIAEQHEILKTLGLVKDRDTGLHVGETTSGTEMDIVLKREAIQRHMFICGTTGSGKSYAMGVVAEELVKHKLPVVFIDTQDEYSVLVQKLGGQVIEPGKDVKLRISSLTESEFLDLLPDAMKKGSSLQCDIATKAFGELQADIKGGELAKFNLSDVIERIKEVAPKLCSKEGDVPRVTDATIRRTEIINRHRIFGSGSEEDNKKLVADWRKLLFPCLAINCKRLTSTQLQSVATAVLRELQDLRLRGHIPPYAAVIDEAHLFVPEGEGSACKQIIREGVRIGRHHGIAIILMTQSPVDIDKRAIRQCNTRLVFALEPDQLDSIRGVKADASEELLRALPKMPQGVCLLSGTYESVKHTIPIKIRIRHTDDSEGGKTPPIFREMTEKWIPEISRLKRETK
ncbi:MAG TPA: ATP-binding protein [Pyrinomonadaceae bacterium]|nr:ATP-binding protein [Pyrinomonadaceae bacterium]